MDLHAVKAELESMSGDITGLKVNIATVQKEVISLKECGVYATI